MKTVRPFVTLLYSREGGTNMKYPHLTRALSWLLAILTLVSVFVIPISADANDGQTAGLTSANGEELTAETAEQSNDTGLYSFNYSKEQVEKLMDAIKYSEYDEQYEDVPKGEEFVVEGADFDPEQTTCETKVLSDYMGMEGDSLLAGDTGMLTYKINVPKTGRYALRLNYIPLTDENTNNEDNLTIATTIERMVYINGELPFSEARYFYLPRVWEYEFDKDDNGNDVFFKDKNGNDVRPRRIQDPQWQDYYLRDWLGYTIDPFEFYLEEGENTISFIAAREEIIIRRLTFYAYEEEPSYEDFIKDCESKGIEEVTGVEPVKIQAEMPDNISVQNIIPTNDRTSALTEPQDPAVIKYNLLDTPTSGNWMRYTVNVPKDGLYKISFRFRQNTLIGMFTSRRLRINGEIQFREASYLRFMFETGFQVTQANNGDQEFLFHLKKGDNLLEMEVVLGDMVDYVYDINHAIKDLNEVYQKMLMITGPIPDTYRDYGFARLVPECIKTIKKYGTILEEIANELEDETGAISDQSNALRNISVLLNKMAKDEYEIAPNFLTFKNYIVSLSDWLYAALSQPLKLDWIMVSGVDEKLPRATTGFIGRAIFEVRAFISSFFMDYTTIGFSDDAGTALDHTIEMWSISDRETMLILRHIVDNYFTPESRISLRIKVITAGLQEAILAGIGPDVSFMTQADAITWGMRTAVLPLGDFDGFEETFEQYPEALRRLLTMTDEQGVMQTYGLPTTMIFPMAYYRLDVLTELGLDPPQTWSELYDMMPTLLNNRLQVGLLTDITALDMFIYQSDPIEREKKDADGNTVKYTEQPTLWYEEGNFEEGSDGGFRINLDSNVALSAFKSLTDMFVKYDSPVAYEVSRFRTGEIPIMIPADTILTYNQLMTFYELRGLWEMAPVIGTYSEAEGRIKRNAVISTQAMIMPRGGYDPNVVWEFVKWYCGDDAQFRLANESVAVSAPTNKYSTANISALLRQKWTDSERAAVKEQINDLVGVPEYPGAYIINYYENFAFMDVYNKGVDPSEALLDQITAINKEISRKRNEFGLDYYVSGYSGNYIKASEAK